jgi:hypothetical protein
VRLQHLLHLFKHLLRKERGYRIAQLRLLTRARADQLEVIGEAEQSLDSATRSRRFSGASRSDIAEITVKAAS